MKKNNNGKISFGMIILGIAILMISVLFIVAISIDINLIISDHIALQEADLNIFQIFHLDFPQTTNPIGPFGAFFGYWLVYFLGKFFSLSLFIGTALMGFFIIFFHSEKHPILKTVYFIIFAFFTNILIFLINPATQEHAGVIPQKIFALFGKIFGETGTIIISSAVIITCLLLIFEVENVKIFFCNLGNNLKKMLSRFFYLIKNIFSKQEKKEKSTKNEFNKKEPIIIDHTTSKDDILPEEKPETIKPTFPDLTQNKKDISNEPRADYQIPAVEDFLTSKKVSKQDRLEIEENIKMVSDILIEKLAEFNVEAEVKNVNIGPIITQYEIEPAPGVKVNKFHTLADDLALAIKAKSIRVQAPIPGRGLVGIEIPNVNRDTIYLKDVLLSDQMKKMKSKLAIGLGKDIAGHPVVADLRKMPHLLIAGATGSGKSVCINTIINSILFRTTPEETRFILIDPKRIELSGYEGIPHLIQEVVTNNEDALTALNWGVEEMERRYGLLQKYRVRDISTYNNKIVKLLDEQKEDEEEPITDKPLPLIVIIVDELADLMMTVGREVERPITRLAQMARAIGIHLILATQRPSIKVITGIIKANFPSRIAFKVSTKIDSRVIIDANGAERLLGLGDSLFLAPGAGNPMRIHGAYLESDEIHDLVNYLKMQPKPEEEIKIIEEQNPELAEFDFDDELFPEAAQVIVNTGSASVSMLQRHFKIGYARAGRLIDMLEKAGIIGPHVGSKPREVLIAEEELEKYGFSKD